MSRHRLTRHSSPERRNSARNIIQSINKKNRKKATALVARLGDMQKVAVRFTSSFSPDLDAIDAFKKGEDYQGYVGKGKNRKLKYEVKGNKLFLLGHLVAEKTKSGLRLNNAGFDTNLTYATFKELGVPVKRIKGTEDVIIGNQKINAFSGEKVNISSKDISPEPVRATSKPVKKNLNRTVTEQSGFRDRAIEKEMKEQGITGHELPLDTTQIQPKDQEVIRGITGIKEKKVKPKRATHAHHLLPVANFPGLKENLNNSIMLTTPSHHELHKHNRPSSVEQTRARIQSKREKPLTGKQRIAKPLDRSPEANEMRAFPLHKKEFAFFDEDFSNIGDDNERVAPVRVESFFKTPERDKRFKDISVPINRKRGSNFREGESPLGNVIEDKRVNRELFKKRGSRDTDNPFDDDVETFSEMFMRKFGPKGIEGPAGREVKVGPFSQGTLSLENARKLAQLKQKIAGIKPLIRKKKTGTIKRKIPVKEGMIQQAKHLSAEALVDNFRRHKLNFANISGVYDPISGKILDANIPADKMRLQEMFESGNNKIGFNSITDTRKGPNTDLNRLKAELNEIERAGGNPAIGFDQGSLEALDVVIAPDDATIMGKLLDHQNSTGILSPTEEFKILDNPKYTG